MIKIILNHNLTIDIIWILNNIKKKKNSILNSTIYLLFFTSLLLYIISLKGCSLSIKECSESKKVKIYFKLGYALIISSIIFGILICIQIISRFTVNINTPYKINIKEEDLPKLNDIEKNYFKKITLDILNNDKSNKPDYFKIGKYIKNYLTYDVSYTNRNLSPKDIYLQKKGVCSHFTILYNSLLNSIDIPTIYVSGIAISEEGNLDKINQIKDQNHAWTLAKINNKWIPLDCTWGLLNGILPVSHIFKYYLKSDIEYILGREKKLSLKEEFKNLDK